MEKRDCLIISAESDYHACAVRYAVRAAGGVCEILDTTKLIHQALPSAHISISSGGLVVGGVVPAFGRKSIWVRRMFRVKDLDGLSPVYTKYVYNEATEFESNIVKGLESKAETMWVNRVSSVNVAELKSHQLSVALQCGLNVPATLIAADPGLIREFCGRLGTVVIKPFSPHSWLSREGNKKWMAFANKITLRDIESCDDAELRAAPCIYQEYVQTVADIRVGVIGEEVFALEMRHGVPGKIDFRTMEDGELFYRRCEVPRDIVRGLQELMQRLDVTIASADFILDDTGQWNFIELNPSGAFLFLEDRCPDIGILSATASFLSYGFVKRDCEREFPCLASFVGSPEYESWMLEKARFDNLCKDRGSVTFLDEVGR